MMHRITKYFATQLQVPASKGKSASSSAKQIMSAEQTTAWYAKILESVRLRFRKLQRFSRCVCYFHRLPPLSIYTPSTIAHCRRSSATPSNTPSLKHLSTPSSPISLRPTTSSSTQKLTKRKAFTSSPPTTYATDLLYSDAFSLTLSKWRVLTSTIPTQNPMQCHSTRQTIWGRTS